MSLPSTMYTVSLDDEAKSKDMQTNGTTDHNGKDAANTGCDVESENKTGSNKHGCFHKIVTFSLVYGFAGLVTQAIALYISSQITTLERQFGLSSGESGFILSCNDIGFLCSVIFISHFGSRHHVPRLLSLGIMMYGISGVLSSLPQFISGVGMPKVRNSDASNSSLSDFSLCRPEVTSNRSDTCADINTLSVHGYNKWIIGFLGVAMMIQGIGKSPRSSLGTVYLDNNVEKTKTGFYLGIVTTMSLFGPFLGIFLGGVFGQIPVDLKETTLTPKDPRWIGAWWIGFLLFGILGILSSIPVFFFPRRMKSAPPLETSEKEKEVDNGVKQPCMTHAKGILQSVLKVLKSKVYVMCLLSLICMMIGIMGATAFGPKYIENQFNVPTWKANMILGIEKLITGTLGTMLGGIMTSRLQMNRRQCLRMIIILKVVTTACVIMEYIFGCENPGIHVHADDRLMSHDCHCEGESYQAVCGSNGETYFTPCHAGCQNVTNNVYHSCINIGGEATAVPGICDSGCPYFIPYIALSVIATLTGTMSIMPFYLVILRSVPQTDRSLGMGILSFTLSLLVFIPAPILFGKIYDSTCSAWQEDCGIQGACALYDIVKLRYTLVSVKVVLYGCSLLFSCVAYILSTTQDGTETKEMVVTKTFKMRNL